MTREQAKQIVLIELNEMLKKHDIDEIYQMCPKPGKNSWAFREELQAVILDEPLLSLDHNFIDDVLFREKYLQQRGKSLFDDSKYEGIKNGTTSTDLIYRDLLCNDNLDVLTDEEKEEIRKMFEDKGEE